MPTASLAAKGDAAGALIGFSELGANRFCGLVWGEATAGAGSADSGFSNGLHVYHLDDSSENIVSSLPLFLVHSFSAPLAREGLKTWRKSVIRAR